ncbi:MAG: phosphoglycerol geranylgeranyltransferase [Methanolobus sp.]|jgi:phosphoglycerol geranylgeranyltransferase|uniref:Geranylgeranylglyceryl phosphate synthase n=1 Tax=Methanolobus tindarius DSM 2278 TaxID=1090322 RepID=W9DXN7_METTI|nr:MULTISPECIES: geranylgeranylglyceryl/heptaprenylglyceryl phosphate synthase [Methanolobus]ETA68472.1 phosphoglycerol geranylgeranyltransferase [Methanolobus tindarius DSM 2278]MDI3487055.1 phosphoglycerol geranylgeranyltransferase [Methanolobus sp.]MDK2832408.1 phosphoglycerol geranylgeranyltransferase [Methanolobus sp.]MDK2938473.1 phosphoglycerol geranylgeranyltransferase [Methanolobus sp.]
MQVEEYLDKIAESEGTVHLTLIDPASQTPDQAAEIAHAAALGGTDAIMVGGSTGAGGVLLDQTLLKIKEKTDKPTILFPGNASGVSKHADAIFFMSLLNSRDINYITTNQAMGAPVVYKSGIEPISMAYIIVEPGGTVGWVGDAKLIPKRKPELAVAYALAGKYLGMHYTYLEAGSGADSPVTPEMIGAVKHVLGNNKLIVGGGIRDGETAKMCALAGADMIVTGTILEESSNVTAKIEELVSAIKK